MCKHTKNGLCMTSGSRAIQIERSSRIENQFDISKNLPSFADHEYEKIKVIAYRSVEKNRKNIGHEGTKEGRKEGRKLPGLNRVWTLRC